MLDRHLTGMIITAVTVLMAGACSSIPDTRAGHLAEGPALRVEPVQTRPVPAVDPQLDHFIAWIPRARAATAASAEALAQVEWGNAKEQVAAELCDGAWLMNGEVTGRSGPFPATAPPALGGYPAWYFRISHKPGFTGCNGPGNDALYAQMRANLPHWILLVRATAEAPAADTMANSVLRLH